jgi:hypothetical protein
MDHVFEGVDAKFLIKNGSVLGGAAILTFLGLHVLKKSLGNEEYSVIKNLITENEFESLKNSEWIDISHKFYEFYNLIPQLYLKLLRRILKFLRFKKETNLKIKECVLKTSLGIPRMARKYLHPIIECIREMRHTIEKEFGSNYLLDFDEYASEIQNIHNTCATNILLDAF